MRETCPVHREREDALVVELGQILLINEQGADDGPADSDALHKPQIIIDLIAFIPAVA